MNKQEAISKIKKLHNLVMNNDAVSCDSCLCSYSETGCGGCEIDGMFDIAVDCIEKQIPRKPTFGGTYKVSEWECPNCKSYFAELNDRPRHCAECGQTIDWSDNDG